MMEGVVVRSSRNGVKTRQTLVAGNEQREPGRYYEATFVTSQGVPEKCGRHRGNRSERIIDVLQAYRSGIDRSAWRFKGHS